MSSDLQQPIVFEPLFMERVWGGRRLAALFGKRLPPGVHIGESWEIVDRPEAQSLVCSGPLAGCSLHELWTTRREEIFGRALAGPRFPLLIKLLDACETLSLQVHPPANVAAELGGEAKTEFWYIAEAAPNAQLYVGLRAGTSREQVEEALRSHTIEEHLHAISVRAGDAMFLPSGRLHAIGAGNVIVEIQENSDTTYRVFDWHRNNSDSRPRELHLAQALCSIDFADHEPALVSPSQERVAEHTSFVVEKWELPGDREVCPRDKFAIVGCLSGRVSCAGQSIEPGEFFLVPAALRDRTLTPLATGTSLLRVTLPD